MTITGCDQKLMLFARNHYRKHGMCMIWLVWKRQRCFMLRWSSIWRTPPSSGGRISDFTTTLETHLKWTKIFLTSCLPKKMGFDWSRYSKEGSSFAKIKMDYLPHKKTPGPETFWRSSRPSNLTVFSTAGQGFIGQLTWPGWWMCLCVGTT